MLVTFLLNSQAMSRASGLLVSSLGLLLCGCPDRSISQVQPQQGGAVKKEIPVSADIDILFVIDNSLSTQDKQTVFAQNFPAFATALKNFPTGEPNLHIAVVDSTVDIKTSGYAPGCPSPDAADDGVFQNTPRVAGCTPPNGRFISDVDSGGMRVTNYGNQALEDALACIAQVGTTGCGFEAQLESMKRALDGSRPENANFIRDGAYLAVIFLTDEDDASVKDNGVFSLADDSVGGHDDYRVQPLFAYKCDQAISASASGNYTGCKSDPNSQYLQEVSFYSHFLGTVKDPAQVVVAAIAAPPPGLMTNDSPPQTSDKMDIEIGPLVLNGNTQPLALQPSCSATINGNPAIGRPAVRLGEFINQLGGKFYTICQSDYSAALNDIGKTLFNAISPCLEGPVDPTDADTANPGLQLQCVVTDVINGNTPQEMDTPIPTCPMQDAMTPTAGGPRPCWWVDTDSATCPAPDTGLKLNIERGGQAPPTGDVVNVQCAVQST